MAASDHDFLSSVAQRVLGNTAVAATTAASLGGLGIDAKRVDSLVPWQSEPVEIDGFTIKKIEPDIESPGNFGLFVRRKLSAK